MSAEDGQLDAVALRDLSILTLVGAQLAASDGTSPASLLAGLSDAPKVPLWVDLMAAAALVVTVAYLVVTGG